MEAGMRGVALVLALVLCQALSAKEYTLSPQSTKLGFKVIYMGFWKVPGSFNDLDGSFNFDEATGQLTKVSVTVEIDSVDTGIPPRDHHLKDRDFFDSVAFPQATFTSAGVAVSLKKPSVLKGILTLRGITQPFAMRVDYLGMTKTAGGGRGPAFKLKSVLDRKSFGVDYAPNFIISDKVGLEIDGVGRPGK
jgi:polyisoprenoid-binding protein YceI